MKIDLTTQKPREPLAASDLSALLGGQPLGAVVTQLPLGRLVPYQNQPFKPYSPEKLAQLAEDIRINGVLSPIIVRPLGDLYQILAGHNRWNASRMAGKDTIPAMVMEVDDDTAALIMVNTNLNQRDQLLPSEKAFAYKVQLDVMKRQGCRTDLTSRQNVGKLEAADILGKEAGESGRQIQRYIRLTYLIPDLLDQVDNGGLSLIPAVALSYLSPEEQELVLEVSGDCERRVSVFQAEQLKKAAADAGLTPQNVAEILLPRRGWNPQQEFVNTGRELIPRDASTDDVEAVLRLIEDYFSRKAG